MGYLGAVGFKLKMRPMERATFFSAWATKKLRGVCVCASALYGNAATRMSEIVPSDGAYAYGGYPDIDALYKQQARETDRKKREALLSQIQQTLQPTLGAGRPRPQETSKRKERGDVRGVVQSAPPDLKQRLPAPRLKGLGIREILIAPRAPWQNPFAERIIGSIRRECLDHIVVINERHLRRLLRRYNATRSHQALHNNSPYTREVQTPAAGRIVAIPQVGGLHHQRCPSAAAAATTITKWRPSLMPFARPSVFLTRPLPRGCPGAPVRSTR